MAAKTPVEIAKPNRLSDRSRAIRFYLEDDEALAELHSLVKHVTNVSIIDLIRDCVRAGRPIIEARWAEIASDPRGTGTKR